MAKIWNYFFVMLWIFYLIASGIHLFSKGFLLSRRVQTERNECIRLKLCADENENEAHCLHKDKINELLTNVNSSSEYCLPQKNRVILVVIDALKHEFGVFDDKLENPLPFQNKLPVFNRLLNEQPNRTRLMKFIADAPTTTLQRLKGITTGSLPTFIDIGSNFATPEINEDNIIDQIKWNNLSTVFMGDSTWTELFPKRFIRSYPFPSFNIYDLDTVDQGINKNLPNELKQQDWSMLIAHYLGVDHCGHKYGPLHGEMARKLTEMNAVIERIIDQMDEETVLFVVGDHGMTTTGDHGGATDDEITSMLFAYNKKYNYLLDTKNDTMDQIDLVPTLAAILGVPIPFSNLGSTNFDIVPDIGIDHLSKSHIQMLHSWQNSKQMRYFFSNYTSDNKDTFSDQMLEDFFVKFYIFSLRVTSLYTVGALDNFNKDVKLYLQDVADKCRFVWAKFDANRMSEGLLFTAVINVFLFLLITNLKVNEFGIVFTRDTLLFIYTSNVCVGLIAYLYHAKFGLESSEQSILTATCIYSIAIIAFLLVQNWDFIALNWSQQQHFSNFFTRIVFIFSVIVFYSNSFIVDEQRVLNYLICGAIILLLYKIHREYVRLNMWRKAKPENVLQSPFAKLVFISILAIFLMRVSYLFHRCREEQGNCTDFQNENSQFEHQTTKTLHYAHVKIIDLLPILLLAVFATVMRQFLRKCGNLSGFSAHVLLARYAPIVAAIACGGHFFMSFQKVGKSNEIQQIRIDALAWVVYLIFALQIIVLLVQPLMVFVLQQQRSPPFSRTSFENIVPEIVMKMKQMYDGVGSTNSEEDDIPIVYGLATVYSSVLWSVCSVFVFVLAILLGPAAANGIFVVLYAAGVVLILNSMLRYQRCPKLEFCIQPEFLSLTLWYLLAHYSFYSTGHQPTLSQINWHAAFVGRTANYDHNNIISALLVLINTFGGPFLVFCLYPLLVIIPTALFVLYPSLLPRRTTKVVIQNQNGTKQWNIVKKVVDTTDYKSVGVSNVKQTEQENDEVNISRGELTLYENEDIFLGSLFKTGCQLVVLQGIRIFSSMLACTIHCRHLMVWKIFAPRFIYEGITTYVMFGAILTGYLIVARIHAAVNRLVVKMTDSN